MIQNLNPYKMKRLLILSLLLLTSITWCFSQTKVTTSTGLYQKPDISSKRITTVIEGEFVQLGQQVGDFWEATYKKKTGYIHKTCLENYVSPIKVEKVIPLIDLEKGASDNLAKTRQQYAGKTPGDELVLAGQLLIAGVAVSLTGSVITGLWSGQATTLKDLRGATYFGIGVGVVALVLEVAGFSKLIEAGKKFNLGMASAGIGLSFRIND